MGDAEDLPFDDDKFDFYTIAFGIRNVTHMEQVSEWSYWDYWWGVRAIARFIFVFSPVTQGGVLSPPSPISPTQLG